MRVLITDLTEMHQGHYCVAGWDLDALKMVRPLFRHSHWTSQNIASYRIVPGNKIQFVALPDRPNGAMPHLSEDVMVDAAKITFGSANGAIWFGDGAPPTCPTLRRAFSNNLQTGRRWDNALQGEFVPRGTACASLSAIRTDVANVEFYEGNYKGKRSLRVHLTDDEETYSLPVVAKDLREKYRQEGADGVNALLPKRNAVHVRVGLARAWEDQPEKCTVMFNGVYW